MDTTIDQPALGGGSPLGQSAGGNVRLFELRGANLNVTTDQAFTKIGSFTRYQVTGVMARGLTGNALIAAGGVYTGAAKAGTAIVAAAQVWVALSALDKTLALTVAALTDALQATPNLSLTTAAGGAATADVFIIGVVLD